MSADNLIRSILFAGVGGQGIIKASDITCQAIMKAGLDVKKSEIHGMAQRGGCVTSQVRYGTKVYSPLAEPGTIHLLVSFEKWKHYGILATSDEMPQLLSIMREFIHQR